MIAQPDTSRTYRRSDSAVFLKTHEQFGGLSNMAGGYPLMLNGTRILSSEALYQACRFPHKPDVQRLIIGQQSPMTAKMVSKPHRKDSRADWETIKVNVMRWCLRVKLAQNWGRFHALLLSTGDLPIVEESRRDIFWGARPVDAETLVGKNVLGRLLMELRDMVRRSGYESLKRVNPPDNIEQFLLLERPIGVVEGPVIHEPPFALSQERKVKSHQPAVVFPHVENMALFPLSVESAESNEDFSDMPVNTRADEVDQHIMPRSSATGDRKRRSKVDVPDNVLPNSARTGGASDSMNGLRNPYWGTFENSAGEHMRFVYDYSAHEGVLYLDKSAQRNNFPVRGGRVYDFTLNPSESLWLMACWTAARERESLTRR